jgi:hypothetical protein
VNGQARSIGARALIRELGDCFEERGWRDEVNLALAITEQSRAVGVLDATAAAAVAPDSFLVRNGIDRSQLQEAISSVFAGRDLLPPESDYPGAINTSFEIHGDGNVVYNVNLGGQQYNLTNECSAAEVIDAVRGLIVEALDTGLSDSTLTSLSRYVESRSDIDQAQIEAATSKAIADAGPEPGKLTRLRDAITTSTASGLLVQAISAAISSFA